MKKSILLLLIVLCTSIYGMAQKSISGVVTDSNKEPMPGVTVVFKNTTTGTVTGMDGSYKLNVPGDASILVFSFIGMETKEVEINGQSVLNVQLESAVTELDEVIAIGYGTVKKSDLTGSVASVKAAELVQASPTSAIDALQGRVAGVQVKSQSGEPGGAVHVNIRGVNSITGGSTPLYVIDGIQIDANEADVATSSIDNSNSFNPLAGLNPEDIESMEFLKDASATAIYGSRGANGVILITTKTGKGGKVTFNYSANAGFSNATNKIVMLDADEYIDYGIEYGYENFFDEEGNLKDLSNAKKYNWEDEAYRTAFSQSHTISLSGGTKVTNYSASLGYLDEEGILVNNSFNRLTGRMNLSHKFSDRFKVDFGMTSADTETNGLTSGGGYGGVARSVLTRSPVIIPDPADDSETFSSPIDEIMYSDVISKLSRYLLSLGLTYDFSKNFSYKISGNSNKSKSKGKEFYTIETRRGRYDNGRAVLKEINTDNYTLTNQLDYKGNINKMHRFSAFVAYEISENAREGFAVDVIDFPYETTGYNDIKIASAAKEYTSFKETYHRVSYLGRLNYNYKGKYFVTGSLRRDGSDRLSEKNRFKNFPSAALAWTVSNENFLKKSEMITNLKMRLSFGETGNERIPTGSSFSRFSDAYVTINEAEVFGSIPSRVANPDLDWETTKQFNGGFDLSMFKSRVNLTFDAYKKETVDMLLDKPLSTQAGSHSRIENIGSLQNKGFEVVLTTHNLSKQKFSWKTDISVSHNKNEVTALGSEGEIIPVSIGRAIIQTISQIEVGQAIGSFYGYEWDGIYQLDDYEDVDARILKPGIISGPKTTTRAGSLKFKDQLTVDTDGDGVPDAGDGIINDDDKIYLGNSNPDFFGGINNTFKYGNFDFNFFLEWQYGNEVFNQSKYNLEGQNQFNITQEFYENKWTEDNPTNKYPGLTRDNDNANLVSSYFVEDGSYLRLANATLGYSLPENLIGRIGFSNVRFYVTGTNLGIWTKYTGYDPDLSSGNILLRGVDRASYPRNRKIIFGLNVTF